MQRYHFLLLLALAACSQADNSFTAQAAALEAPSRAQWQKSDSVLAQVAQLCGGNLKGKIVLDLGAGTGYFTFRLAPLADSVLALEASPYFLQYLAERKDTSHCKNVAVLPIDSVGTGISALRADVVLVVDTWPLLAQRVQYAGRLHAVLKKNGYLVIANPRTTAVQETLDELRRGGFRNFEVDSMLLPRQYWIVAHAD